LYTQTQKLDVDVYMTVGALESQDDYLSPFAGFVEQITSRNYEGLHFISKIYDEKDHYTVWKPTIMDGLKMFLVPE